MEVCSTSRMLAIMILPERKPLWDSLIQLLKIGSIANRIAPAINLLSNIGIGKDSSNTQSLPYKYIKAEESRKKLKFPLKYPSKFLLDSKHDLEVEDTIFSKSIYNRLLWIVRKFIK